MTKIRDFIAEIIEQAESLVILTEQEFEQLIERYFPEATEYERCEAFCRYFGQI